VTKLESLRENKGVYHDKVVLGQCQALQ
jgi:hypothetical protein